MKELVDNGFGLYYLEAVGQWNILASPAPEEFLTLTRLAVTLRGLFLHCFSSFCSIKEFI